MGTQTGDYSIDVVCEDVSDDLRSEVSAFWLRHGAIARVDEAHRRADELVCVARNPRGAIVGVNTAYVSNLRAAHDRYFLFRMFIRPADRHLALTYALTRTAVAALRTQAGSERDIRGVALVTENPKLMRRSGARILTDLGWTRAGKDRRGLDVWSIEFDDSTEGDDA